MYVYLFENDRFYDIVYKPHKRGESIQSRECCYATAPKQRDPRESRPTASIVINNNHEILNSKDTFACIGKMPDCRRRRTTQAIFKFHICLFIYRFPSILSGVRKLCRRFRDYLLMISPWR